MRRVFLLVALCFCAISGWAVTVNLTTAGSLGTTLTANELSATVSLTITGVMNNEDFSTMQISMPALENVDLGSVVIEANGPYNYANSLSLHAFAGKSLLKTIVLPTTCERVLDFAFSGCSGLTSVVLPNSIIALGHGAFQDCTGLTSISMSQFVTDIASTAFIGCSNLPALNISSNNPNYKTVDGVLFSKDLTTLIAFPSGKLGAYTVPSTTLEIGGESFYGCKGITTLNIPASVISFPISECSQSSLLTAINVDASNPNLSSQDGVVFNKSMTTIIRCPDGKKGVYAIPNSVTEIEGYAFWGCSQLTELTIPNTVVKIGNVAFSGCAGLNTIVIPNSVISVGTDFCANCSFLTSATLSNNLSTLPQYSFIDCIRLTHITIPNNIESIATGAFHGCTALAEVNLPSNLKTLGQGAFIECSSLPTITIPSGVTTLESYLFYGCRKLESINIPTTVTTIGERVFQQCTGLITFSIPATITEVGAFAFEGCTGLTTCTIPASVTSIGSEAFENCAALTSLTALGLEPINLLSSNAVFRGVNYNKCTLYVVDDVDHMTKWKYAYANQWKAFFHITPIVTTAVNSLFASNDFDVFGSNGELTVLGAEVGKVITVFDIHGRIVVSKKASSSSVSILLKSGIYIVQMGYVSRKIVL